MARDHVVIGGLADRSGVRLQPRCVGVGGQTFQGPSREEDQEVEELPRRNGRMGCRRCTAALPAHAVLHGIGRRGVGEGRFSFVTVLCDLLGAHIFPSGQAWAEGEGELATCRHRADCGQENWVKCTPP